MNKKLLSIGVALFLLLLVVWLIFFRNGGTGGSKLSNPPAKNEESIEKRLNWLQNSMSVNVFTTREDPEGAKVEDKQMVHIIFTSYFSFSANDGQKVKKIEIFPVSFRQGIGTQVSIQPSHEKLKDGLSRSYIFTAEPTIKNKNIPTGLKSIVLTGVTETNIVERYFDEVFQGGDTINFALVSKNLGIVSEQEILRKDKVYESSKVLEYLGVSQEKLRGEIVIDFRITFDDGKRYQKRFTGVIDGQKILSEPFYLVTMIPE
ncbi:MAG: hypothetical protein ACOYT9_03295 [Patescibacteria group bacterium]